MGKMVLIENTGQLIGSPASLSTTNVNRINLRSDPTFDILY